MITKVQLFRNWFMQIFLSSRLKTSYFVFILWETDEREGGHPRRHGSTPRKIPSNGSRNSSNKFRLDYHQFVKANCIMILFDMFVLELHFIYKINKFITTYGWSVSWIKIHLWCTHQFNMGFIILISSFKK